MLEEVSSEDILFNEYTWKKLIFMHYLFRIFIHPQIFSIFLNYLFGNIFFTDFFLLFGKNDQHTFRVYVRTSQIGLLLDRF